MKKCIALFLTLILALCAPGLSLAEESSKPDIPAAQQRILSDWFDYLFARENMHADMLWVVDAVDNYVANPSWETKLIASMAATTATRYISQRGLDERLATFEDYDVFAAYDADVDFIMMELDNFEAERDTQLLFLQIILDYLDSSSYLISDLYSMRQESELMRHVQESNLAYLKVTTEYILYNLDAQGLNFRSFVAEHCPNIHGSYISLPDMFMEDATLILDELEAMNREMADLESRQQESLDRLKAAAESGDWSAIQAEATWIDGLPALLPDPGWSLQEGSEAFYYWKDGDNPLTVPGERDVIDRIPDGYRHAHPALPREEVLTYRDFLSALGLNPIGEEITDSAIELYYEYSDCTFVILWSPEETTLDMLDNPLCLAPLWYIEAMEEIN